MEDGLKSAVDADSMNSHCDGPAEGGGDGKAGTSDENDVKPDAAMPPPPPPPPSPTPSRSTVQVKAMPKPSGNRIPKAPKVKTVPMPDKSRETRGSSSSQWQEPPQQRQESQPWQSSGWQGHGSGWQGSDVQPWQESQPSHGSGWQGSDVQRWQDDSQRWMGWPSDGGQWQEVDGSWTHTMSATVEGAGWSAILCRHLAKVYILCLGQQTLQ